MLQAIKKFSSLSRRLCHEIQGIDIPFTRTLLEVSFFRLIRWFDFLVIVINKYPVDAVKMTQTIGCGNTDIPMASVVKGRIIETIPCL